MQSHAVPNYDCVDSNVAALPPPHSDELYYFADICAGPGGFSEYMLWRRLYSCHGFGMTLKGARVSPCDDCTTLGLQFVSGKDDFRLSAFAAAPPEFFETHYGTTGDGDITITANIHSFARLVHGRSDGGRGAHVCMADGVRAAARLCCSHAT